MYAQVLTVSALVVALAQMHSLSQIGSHLTKHLVGRLDVVQVDRDLAGYVQIAEDGAA